MIRKTREEVTNLIKKIFEKRNIKESHIDILAEHLISANLNGVDTHGIFKIPKYLQQIKDKELLPNNEPEIIKETETTALISGNWTFGQITAKIAMETAIKKAKKNGISISGIVKANHIGRLGYYSEMASNAGMIALIMGGGFSEETANAAPFGGKKAVLCTNPISMGFPAKNETPVIIDFATTKIAGNKVGLARENNKKIPLGNIIDKNGNDTTDPDDFFDGGALLPFGKHKGYALMLAAEFLGRILTGSDLYAENNKGGEIYGNSGATMIVFKADVFRPYEDFLNEIDEMEQRVKDVPPASNFNEVLVPGDIEKRTRYEREEKGIPVSKKLWDRLENMV